MVDNRDDRNSRTTLGLFNGGSELMGFLLALRSFFTTLRTRQDVWRRKQKVVVHSVRVVYDARVAK